MIEASSYTAFAAQRCLATGDLLTVARAAKQSESAVLILDDATGYPVELDLRFDAEQAVAEHASRTAAVEAPRPRQGRGRPKLGVVAREVTLLPRHWEWLAGQPGGASAALRRLVEDARRSNIGPDRARASQEALYRAMVALAGDLPGFEEASRALFAGDDVRFDAVVGGWPDDLAAYAARLATVARSARV